MAVSSASSQSAAQAGWEQLQLRQAQRNAEQAAQKAQQLRAQASEAERQADQSREQARSLRVESSQADKEATRVQQGLKVRESASDALTRLGEVASQAAQTAGNASASTTSIVRSRVGSPAQT